MTHATLGPVRALHMGSGEPVLLLQPFMLSAHAWDGVAQLLATRYEVFAPTFAGHWGGPQLDNWDVSPATLADTIERQLDELGWDTCHIVGNSLGGWVAFELERRGRARSVTAIAPAGGWHHLSRDAILVGLEFLSLGPLIGIGKLLGGVAARNRVIQRTVLPLLVKDAKAVSSRDAEAIVLAAIHCSAYLPVLWTGMHGDGVSGLADVTAPVRLLLCEHDHILPVERYGKMFVDELPAHAEITVLDGVGHCPQFEAPERIAALITEHISASGRHLQAV